MVSIDSDQPLSAARSRRRPRGHGEWLTVLRSESSRLRLSKGFPVKFPQSDSEAAEGLGGALYLTGKPYILWYDAIIRPHSNAKFQQLQCQAGCRRGRPLLIFCYGPGHVMEFINFKAGFQVRGLATVGVAKLATPTLLLPWLQAGLGTALRTSTIMTRIRSVLWQLCIYMQKHALSSHSHIYATGAYTCLYMHIICI